MASQSIGTLRTSRGNTGTVAGALMRDFKEPRDLRTGRTRREWKGETGDSEGTWETWRIAGKSCRSVYRVSKLKMIRVFGQGIRKCKLENWLHSENTYQQKTNKPGCPHLLIETKRRQPACVLLQLMLGMHAHFLHEAPPPKEVWGS